MKEIVQAKQTKQHMKAASDDLNAICFLNISTGKIYFKLN